jgi:hypothetical protein
MCDNAAIRWAFSVRVEPEGVLEPSISRSFIALGR